MPKRKVSRTCEEELDHLMRKMRKLEKKIQANNTVEPMEVLPETEYAHDTGMY